MCFNPSLLNTVILDLFTLPVMLILIGWPLWAYVSFSHLLSMVNMSTYPHSVTCCWLVYRQWGIKGNGLNPTCAKKEEEGGGVALIDVSSAFHTEKISICMFTLCHIFSDSTLRTLKTCYTEWSTKSGASGGIPSRIQWAFQTTWSHDVGNVENDIILCQFLEHKFGYEHLNWIRLMLLPCKHFISDDIGGGMVYHDLFIAVCWRMSLQFDLILFVLKQS